MPASPTSFIVTLECRDRLAMSGKHGNYSACKKIDFGSKRPICVLHDHDDTQVLIAYVGMSGASQVYFVGRIDLLFSLFEHN